MHILAAVKHLPFFPPKMEKHDVTKEPFSQKKISKDFVNFNGRRQINADEGTECFAPISAAVFGLLRKSGRGTESVPPAHCVQNRLLARHGAKKIDFRSEQFYATI